MSSEGNNQSPETLIDKLRSMVGLRPLQKDENSLPPKAHFSIWYVLLAALLFSYLQPRIFSDKVETIPYSQFKQYLAEAKLSALTIGPDTIKATVIGPPEKKVTHHPGG